MSNEKLVLIVDDNNRNLKLLSQILRNNNYKIALANNGKKSLQVATSKDIDLILLDIMMPGINGFEVCKKLKANTETKDIPVIFISALKEVEDKIKSFEVGGVDYITKPFNKKEVLSRVKTHLVLDEQKVKLEKKNEDQRILLDNIEGQIWYLSDEKTYGMVNQKFADFVGLEKSEIENKTIFEIRDKREIGKCISGNQKVFQKKEKIFKEEWVKNSREEKRLLEIIKTPKLNQDDQVEYVVCTAFDITEKNKQKEIIKELHNIAINFKELDNKKEVCQKTIDAASKILNYDLCHISLVKDNKFVPEAHTENMEAKTLPLDYGIGGKSYKNKQSYLTLDSEKDPDASPTKKTYKSGITIPMEGLGVFQAIATQKNKFKQEDLELAETLISHTQAALERINSQEKLEQKNTALKETKDLLDEEIEKARKIHQRTLSNNITDIKGLNIHSYYQPATNIGGDFYNFIKLGEKRLLFYLADITGHGLDSAIMCNFVKNTISSYLSLIPADKKINPKEIIEFIYKQNQKSNLPGDYFITIILGIVDIEESTLVYSSAGMHIPPVICRNNIEKDYIEEISAGGLPISTAFPTDVEYNNYKIDLDKGDTLFFSTDGIYEQKGRDGTYGDRYKELICQNSYLPPGAIIQNIYRDFNQFHEGKVNDDITFAIIQLESEQDYPELNFEINSSKSEVDRAKSKVVEFIKSENQKIKVDDITIAFHEMLINALEHGNKFDETKKVKIRLRLKEKFLELSVKDEGQGFNWKQIKEKKSNSILDIQDEVAARGRGLGFMIAHTVSDYLFYNHEGNQIFFIKEY